jgi:hypothetical protein
VVNIEDGPARNITKKGGKIRIISVIKGGKLRIILRRKEESL